MSAGYQLATRYEVLYRGYAENDLAIDKPIYGVPWKGDINPRPGAPRYRGVDREPLRGLTIEIARLFTEAGSPAKANPATELLYEIETRTGREDGWVTSPADIGLAWAALGDEQSDYEIIWAKEYEDTVAVPEYCRFIGCDIACFDGDQFSCICDALFFPRWHGTDLEGVLFKEYYDLLNSHVLLDSNELALQYLDYYLSFDWTEHIGNFTSIEVYEVDLSGIPLA